LLKLERGQEYTRRFLRELSKYSFRYHFQGEEGHEGCRSWINEIEKVDYSIPEQHSLQIKADMDGLQQKRHARNYYVGFLEAFN
jgi:hypothetical protein